jgi:HSP20 family protein
MQDRKRDQILDRPWQVDGYIVWRGTRRFSPPTDVLELPDKLMIVVEIAGMRAGDVNVVLADGRLIITGTRERPTLQNAAFHQVEIGYGEFRVEVYLPWSVEREQVTASYRDGFLQIDLPRHPDANFRVVDVHVNDDDE